jgi:SAM-dependent methyltransferase
MARRKHDEKRVETSWDPLAAWYDGWVGEGGSEHHQKLAIPAALELLDLDGSDRVLDVGAGQGVLAPSVAETGAGYCGVDAGSRLIGIARRRHGGLGEFIVGDARKLESVKGLAPESFSAVVFLLSLQDMDPLDDVLRGAAWALRPGGRLVALLTHPCFRIPRQSGWGWDEGRKLQYRRIDRYLTPLPVPLKAYPGETGVSRSFHRPLSDYINGLGAHGLFVSRILEIPTYKRVTGDRSKAINRANEEIPLFLGLRAEKK